jgi:hypothetical protein
MSYWEDKYQESNWKIGLYRYILDLIPRILRYIVDLIYSTIRFIIDTLRGFRG